MFGNKRNKKIRVKLSDFGSVPMNFNENEWIFDPSNGDFILTVGTKVIDCDKGGTCNDKEDGGFRIELTPID